MLVPEPSAFLTELLIDSPPSTLEIIGDVEITADAEVNVTSSYSQASATVESILAVTHTGTLTGLFANEGEHLRDGIFVDAIHYNLNDIMVDILQAAPGDLDGNKQVDSDDIQQLLAALSYNNPGAGPGPSGAWDWIHGDFTGDGLVDSDDIQAMLGAGFLNAGPYAAIRGNVVVPEPSTIALSVLALLSLLAHSHRRRRA